MNGKNIIALAVEKKGTHESSRDILTAAFYAKTKFSRTTVLVVILFTDISFFTTNFSCLGISDFHLRYVR